ncbi:sensor histidine kinase [Streptomyces sp. NRRL F-5727]|uniref:sensor histidine kinase n=1 Tax=Streptomyces sp. NRRL F-5727 TaxID=1463871 RepID=UPI001F43656D|nr:HAMP domain-containing sensor histidine kinase [Streptomyces sp. NRRL F-5727]
MTDGGVPPLRGRRRRSVRWRFTSLYAGLFLASGVVMLAVVAAFAGGSLDAAPGPESSGTGPGSDWEGAPAAALERIAALEHQLAAAQDRQTRQLLLGSAVGLLVMGALSLLLGWYAAGRVLRPLSAMTTATRRISADNLHERLAVGGPHDELRDLGDTIDELLTRLEGSFAAQRRFVADASHELRTPLATMRAAVDVTLAKPGPLPDQTRVLAGRVRTELDQVDSLLDGLLTLARAQHELPDPEAVPLGRLAADALAAQRQPVERTLDDGAPEARVRGNRTLLRRLVENLVDNAVVHNEPGGWVLVRLRADTAAVELVVENGGKVLSTDQAAELTRPFRRGGPGRTGGTGSGLGLAIVAAVTEAHGGRLVLHPREDGGLRVAVTLPRTPGPAGEGETA